MGSGDKHLLNFHLHLLHLIHHHNHQVKKEHIPKGCLAIRVGQEGEEQQRFVVPVDYFNHPLFMSLLKVAEDEYGFDHKGPITIPCHVAQFQYVQGIIDKEEGHGHGHGHGHHHHHNNLVSCFRA